MKKFAVLGHPVKHSKSPKIFGLLADRFQIPMSYDLVDISPEELLDSKEKLKSYDGFNITTPHKNNILELASQKVQEVQVLRAANVFKQSSSGEFVAYNTDVEGFVGSLRNYSLKGKTALVLGSSGAAKAAILGLYMLGVKDIFVKARNLDSLQGFEIPIQVYRSDLKPNVIVQATTIGLNKTFDEMSESKDLDFFNIDFSDADIAYDLNYAPKLTAFMEVAKKNNVPYVLNGEDMLMLQALKTFEIWFEKSLTVVEKTKLMKDLKEIL